METMYTKVITTDAPTERVQHYAMKLRDLVLEAAAEGVQLEIKAPPQPALPDTDDTQIEVLASVPERYHHHYYAPTVHIAAKGVASTNHAFGETGLMLPFDRDYQQCFGKQPEIYNHLLPKPTHEPNTPVNADSAS